MSDMTSTEQKLVRFAQELVNQQAARVIVEPQDRASGFWFGGGNMVQAPDGKLYLVGRYRNAGDSRTGTAAGVRGLELAVFRSDNRGGPFEKVLSFSKSDLDEGDRRVLSIEGAALSWSAGLIRLYVSTEKDGVGYPPEVESFLKPGTGVWSIDLLEATELAELKTAPVQPVLESTDPRYIQIKDPFLAAGGTQLLFCSHPFCWSSSNTGAAQLMATGLVEPGSIRHEIIPRGTTWDVAMTRGTAILPVPQVGEFEGSRAELLFYDGGECVRDLEQHAEGVKRPRGYSCEELGGLAWRPDPDAPWIRLSRLRPLFVSPYGTGCSRYVDVLPTDEGFLATWQQSQTDLSQPLVMHFLSHAEVARILG